MNSRLSVLLGVYAALMLLSCDVARAGFAIRPVSSGKLNQIGLGVSYGVKLDKDAYFYGYAPDYVRVLNEKWLLNLSLAYDRDTETKSGTKNVTETWTPAIMIGYQMSPRFAFGAGLGHGLTQNKDSAGWESVKWGDDLTIAAAVAAALWIKERHSLSLSFSLEHNISDNEPSVSLDLGYAWDF